MSYGVKFVIDAYRGRFGCINSDNKTEIFTNIFSSEVWNDWWNSLYEFDCEFIEFSRLFQHRYDYFNAVVRTYLLL